MSDFNPGILVVIPARGGSKGLPGKNILPLQGVPLIVHTVRAALALFDASRIYISTDDQAIKETVENWTGVDVPALRPAHLATDEADMHSVLQHAIRQYEELRGEKVNTVILLQPTSPLRRPEDIKGALAEYEQSLPQMVVSVHETQSNPYYVLFEENHEGYLVASKSGDFPRRQDCPKVYEYNGAVYVMAVSAIKVMPRRDFTKVRKYVMPARFSVDVDTALDFEFASFLMSKSQDLVGRTE